MRKGSGKEKLKKPLPYLNQITAFGTQFGNLPKFQNLKDNLNLPSIQSFPSLWKKKKE
jgi:hypothetical protein